MESNGSSNAKANELSAMEHGESSQAKSNKPSAMERGEPSNAEVNKNNESHSLSPMTLATLSEIQKRRRGRFVPQRAKSTMHDNTSFGYGWLLPGWVAEERHMKSGRIYRYYYDPSGRLYRSQHEVLHAWEDSGLVVIDK